MEEITPFIFHVSNGDSGILNRPVSKNLIYFSEFQQLQIENAFRNFSIKLVLSEKEYYQAQGKEFLVSSGEYLLASKQPDGKLYFANNELTKGICIDIDSQTIAEACTVLFSCGNHLDNYLSGYFLSPDFVEKVNHVDSSIVGGYLKKLIGAYHTNDSQFLESINREWFLGLAEKIVFQECNVGLALSGIKSVHISTRKEILRRILMGKDFMDEMYLGSPAIAEIAKVANLSEFHFFRCFRDAFKITPYQYMVNKRLEHAIVLMKQGYSSLSHIACECGYPDLFTFSKAFKRKFGYSPRNFMKNDPDLYKIC